MKAFALCSLLSLPLAYADTPSWPTPNREAKPWTRWWWLGSGVDAANLTRELEAFAAQGLGGVEICPIYGARGFEQRDLPFLSTPWVTAYRHTARECHRLNLGIDLTTGTGWPFGGSWVPQDLASASLEPWLATVSLPSSKPLPIPQGQPIVILASSPGKTTLRLESNAHNGFLDLSSLPPGPWQLKGLFSRHAIQKVKRAAPGAAGWVLDPFSTQSIDAYLKPFTTALTTTDTPSPRSHFHDSFEYYGAAWTPNLLESFLEQNGYNLVDQLDAFLGLSDDESCRRVRADYRATLSTLHQHYLEHWHTWAARHGSLTRNQAHGSPGNLLDHYAVADIPETEIFRKIDETQWPMLQFAASAASLNQRQLVSAETFTWLDEHFQVTPDQLKEAVDFVWLGGVNHVFYHGIPYSPLDAPWPGWLFYASTHMGPNGGLWPHQSRFNTYITRVQSFLQQGHSDADILLYFPIHDLWHDGHKGLPLFTLHHQHEWLHPTSFYQEATRLRHAGYFSHFISDQWLEHATVKDGKILVGSGTYATLILPPTRYLPLPTARKLVALQQQGARIFSVGPLPTDVPGFGNLSARRKELQQLLGPKTFPSTGDAVAAARLAGIAAESWLGKSLAAVRRQAGNDTIYFIVNRSPSTFSAPISPCRKGATLRVMDPMGGRIGDADASTPFHLILQPGESRLLHVLHSPPASPSAPWQDFSLLPTSVDLDRPCRIEFVTGGPEIPPPAQLPAIAPWTSLHDPAYQNFSGTAVYHLTFETNETFPAVLDLGRIGHTARVWLNGHDLGMTWSTPHHLATGQHLVVGTNHLRIEVANLAANRIAALDRSNFPWKKFHEINFVNIDYQPFDASSWPTLPSGLLTPPRLLRLVPAQGGF